jgi:5-methylcytosine-specific restriction endonuclease McrA
LLSNGLRALRSDWPLSSGMIAKHGRGDLPGAIERLPCMPPRADGHCVCGEPLPRRKSGELSRSRRWCSEKCSEQATLRHYWPEARSAALARNRRAGGLCDHCGSVDPGRRTDGKRYRYRSRFEVNHIVPLNGSQRSWSCLNHSENLETLCHSCHLKVTNAQRLQRTSASLQLRKGELSGVQKCEATPRSPRPPSPTTHRPHPPAA